MRRRDFSKAVLGSSAASALLGGRSEAQTGSPPYYGRTASEVVAGVVPTNHAYAFGNVLRYGALGDWNGVTGTNNAIAFNNAIECLFANGGGILFIPKGFYRIASALNFAGTGKPAGRNGNSPIIVQGEGMPNAFGTGSWTTYGGSWIVGQTGNWIVDCTGVQFLKFDNIGFRGTGVGASNKGILCARSTEVRFSQDISFEKCVVWIDSFPRSTQVGSIAIANNGAEQWVMEQCWLIADTPYTVTFKNSTDLKLSSIYAQIADSPTSSTMMNHRNCTFQAWTGFACHIQGGADLDFDTCIWTAEPFNKTGHGIRLLAGGNDATAHCQSIRLSGQVESFPGCLRIDDPQVWNIRTDLLMPSPKAPYVSAGAAVFNGCIFNIRRLHGSTGQFVIACNAASTMAGGEIVVYNGDPGPTANTNLICAGTLIRGQNADMSGPLGFAAGSSYLALGNRGTTIVQPTGLPIAPNVNNNATADASPNAPTSYLKPDGTVRLAGTFVPKGSSTITAGVAVGTVASPHRPNRECDAVVYVAGKISHVRIFPDGRMIFGDGVDGSSRQAANIDGISFQLIN